MDFFNAEDMRKNFQGGEGEGGVDVTPQKCNKVVDDEIKEIRSPSFEGSTGNLEALLNSSTTERKLSEGGGMLRRVSLHDKEESDVDNDLKFPSAGPGSPSSVKGSPAVPPPSATKGKGGAKVDHDLPPPPPPQGLVESEFDTLKTGTTTKQNVDPATMMSEDEVEDDDVIVQPSSPPVSPQALTEEVRVCESDLRRTREVRIPRRGAARGEATFNGVTVTSLFAALFAHRSDHRFQFLVASTFLTRDHILLRDSFRSSQEIVRRKAEQQYHVRFQATNQPWREDMADDVKALHDGCCSDFEKSGICIEDFTGITDFKEIGAGAFACVYKATWEGNVVAVKKLATGVGQPMTLKTIRDFRTEAQLQRTLQHENIVR